MPAGAAFDAEAAALKDTSFQPAPGWWSGGNEAPARVDENVRVHPGYAHWYTPLAGTAAPAGNLSPIAAISGLLWYSTRRRIQRVAPCDGASGRIFLQHVHGKRLSVGMDA